VVETGPQHRARQALRAAEQLSRTVVEGLEEGVLITDAQLRAVSWNAAAAKILGLPTEDLEGALAPFAPDGALLDADGVPVTAENNFVARAARTQEYVRDVLRRPGTREGERWITVLARPIASRPGSAGGFVCTLANVTQTVQAERRLREERDRAQRYLEVASTLVVVLDHHGDVELINRQGCDLLGFTAEELVGRDWFSTVLPERDRLDARLAFTRLVSGVEPPAEVLETVIQTRAGNDRMIAWRNAVLTDERGQIVSVLRSGEDVTERRNAEAQVAFLAYHDRLTGLPNRAMLEEQLARDLALARRHERPIALIYLDLDDFKLVNDSLGHPAGDFVLRETAKRVAELTRAGDLLCRQGGDEFLLLLNCSPGDDPAAIALQTGERIASALDEPFSILDAEFHVGASIGAALFPAHADDAESLFKIADAAMYQAKRLGAGSVVLYEPEDTDPRRRLSLATELRRAVSDGQLRLHYQPICRVTDGSLRSLEALVRWEHPEQGLVPPSAFIGVAEQTGLIAAIGDWVVSELCRQASLWAAQGRRPLLAFNVSPRQLRRLDLVQSIVETIESHDLAPRQFCVEVTETSVLSDERRHRSLLGELHEAGITIAIDDFGSGHSSLGRLRELPVEVLKVDRSFLSPVPADGRSAAIVAAMLELSQALGMSTIVEGVEEQSQLEFLAAHDCPLAQGFLIGRPCPAAAIDAERLPVRPELDPAAVRLVS